MKTLIPNKNMQILESILESLYLSDNIESMEIYESRPIIIRTPNARRKTIILKKVL